MGTWVQAPIPSLEGTDWAKGSRTVHPQLEARTGPRSTHLAAGDVNWRPGGYQYRDDHLEIVWVTSVPTTLGEALEYFHKLRTFGVKYIERREPGQSKWDLLPYEYDTSTSEVRSLVS